MVDRIIEQVLTRRVTTAVQSWPEGADTVRVELGDTLFLPGTACLVTIEISRDGGATWQLAQAIPWVGGAKSRTGASPSIELGPYTVFAPTRADPLAMRIDNPGHYRVHIEPTRGSPVVGIR